MTAEARSWLPASTLGLDIVGPALAPLLDAWTDSWFTRARTELVACQQLDRVPAQAAAAQRIMLEHSGCFLDLSARGKRTLLEAALGIDLSEVALAEADHRLLDSFATDIGDDLLKRIDPAPHPAKDSLFRLELKLNHEELLFLHCPASLLISAIKARAQQNSKLTPLDRRWNAVGSASITAAALAGRALLSIDELDGLGVGDVVILDRRTDDPIDLVLASSGEVIAHGKISRDQDRRTLIL